MKRYLYLFLIIALLALQACATDAAPSEEQGALIPPVSESDSPIQGSAGGAPAQGKGSGGGGTTGTACAAPSGTGAATLAAQVVDLVNQERAKVGLAALTSQSQLVTAAQRHSNDMATNTFMSHDGSDGSTPYTRINDTGYFTGSASWSYGENVAAGYATASTVMTAWMNSQVHRDNILNSTFREIGVAYVYNANDTTLNYCHYWTMALGKH